MNICENVVEPKVEETKVVDIVGENSELLSECRAIANCIKSFIKVNNVVNEKMCDTPCGNGANCMYDELMNQTETIKDIKVLLNDICSTLGC